MADATLGQFFEVWGVPFSKTQLGPYHARGGKVMRMWVDGKPSKSSVSFSCVTTKTSSSHWARSALRRRPVFDPQHVATA